MAAPLPLPTHLPWIQRCLAETGWTDWHPVQVLGAGTWSLGILVERAGRRGVLVLDRPDRPPITKAGAAGTLCLYRSGAAIRRAGRDAGLPMARTLGAPRAWSGGAAVLMSRVRGCDLVHRLADPSLDGEALGRRAAELVAASRALGPAHAAHATGVGNHLFGHAPARTCPVARWRDSIAPLRGHEAGIDALLDRLEALAARLLPDTPRATQL